MGFKFWLQPGDRECYHELLEKGSRLYFMYEILNAHNDDSSFIAYFRNADSGKVIGASSTSERGHLEILINETSKISFDFIELTK
jgi:hypothetical protein